MSKVRSTDIGELHQSEIDLIYLIRNVYRFGEVVIQTRDGIPQDIIKTTVRVRLGQLSTDDVDTFSKQFTIEGR